MIRTFFAAVLALLAMPALAADYFVLNANPDGEGSLAIAIARANASPGPDRIRFNIGGPGPHVISPSWLLEATDTVEIDGYSQPGSSANTAEYGSNAQIRIVLSGDGLPVTVFSALLTLRGYGSKVSGIAFVRGPHDTLLRLQDGEHQVVGNFFGLYPDGTTTGSSVHAIQVRGEFNQIGSPAPADRNVFAAADIGIRIAGRGAVRNVVRNNLFGTTADGLQARPLREFAVLVTESASLNRIGDFANTAGNVMLGAATGTGTAVRIGGHDTQGGEPESIGNAVLGNTLVGYRNRAIELKREPGACSPNDGFDQDTGPNRCMNLPVIRSAHLLGGRLRVQGHVDTEPTTQPGFPKLARVYLYGNAAACGAGPAEAEFQLAAKFDLALDANGHAEFDFDVPAGSLQPRSVTAQLGIEETFVDSTSELSPCQPVVTPPSAPTLTDAVAGDGQATLHFTAPASNGGAPLLDYRIECTPGPVVSNVLESPTIIGGLQNDIHYSCTVRARNAAGFSVPSAARQVTPRAQRAPELQLPETANARIWEYFDLPLPVDGYPVPTLSLQGTLPKGVQFHPAERRLSGWPERGAVGSYTLHVTASNGVGAPVTRTMTLHVGRGMPQLRVDSVADPEAGGDPFVIGIRSDSSGAFTLTASTPAVCGVQRVADSPLPSAQGDDSGDANGMSGAAGALVTMRAAGRCEFVVDQAATDDFEKPDPVTVSFTIRTPGSGAVLFADGFE